MLTKPIMCILHSGMDFRSETIATKCHQSRASQRVDHDVTLLPALTPNAKSQEVGCLALVAGPFRQYRFQPRFAQFWREDGSQSLPILSRRQMLMLFWMVHFSSKRKMCTAFHKHCAASVEGSRWAHSQSGHGERYHHRVCQQSQNQLIKDRSLLA